jgi:hypothetical protein
MLKTKVKDKYQGLSRQELLDKVYDLGFNFEKYSESCSQTTAIALHEILDFDDVVVKVATSVCAGHAGEVIGTCGALIGGTMVLDWSPSRKYVLPRTYRSQLGTPRECHRSSSLAL